MKNLLGNSVSLVLDKITNDYWLFIDSDNEIVEGKVGTVTLDFLNPPPGKTGKLSGYLWVDNIPFEYSSINTNSPLNEKGNIMKGNYQYLDPERGLTKPPSDLNAKQKKKWWREYRNYKESIGQKILTPEEKKEIHRQIITTATEKNKTKTEEGANNKKPEEQTAKKEEELKVKTETSEKRLVLGAGNAYGRLEDGNYVIARYFDKSNEYALVSLPKTEDGFIALLVFPSERQAAFCKQKLAESDSFAEIVDTCKIYSIDQIRVEDHDLPAAVIKNVVTFLQNI